MGNEQSTQKKHQKANTVQNGDLNGHAVPAPDLTEPVANKDAEPPKSEVPPAAATNEPKPSAGKEEVDKANGPETSPDTKTDAEPPKQDLKPTGEEVSKFFGKMFKKKEELVKPASENKDSVDGQTAGAEEQQSEPAAVKTSTEAEPASEGAALELLEDLVEVAEEITQSEDVQAPEKTVMNFFKTFKTKTSKEAKVTPDASKDQSQKEAPAAPSANVQEAPKAPPPPPPAPPKMEGKAEAAVKKEEASAAESSAKTKVKDRTFGKLFRPKPVEVEEIEPVEFEVEVDASKTSTLEAAAKPENPPAPKPEGKKLEKKSTFGRLFKPKATEPKKQTAAAPGVTESPPAAKAKEELKSAPPVAPAVPVASDNKPAGGTDKSSPSVPPKLEKRDSFQLFLKNLVK